jgi:16S rRNA C967 or C1407 C5-methylase (RsmB/RsmF family)
MVEAAVGLVKPGGVIVYSVCTLTDVEGPEVGEHLRRVAGSADELPAPSGGGWERTEPAGYRLLPDVADTDGMYLVRVQTR